MAGKTRISLGAVSAAALALALAACGPQQRQASVDNQAVAAMLPPLPQVQPLVSGPATPIRRAPPTAALPAVQRLGYADAPRDDRYAWIDRADWISDTIGDAPPDYSFDYDGVEPWVWQTSGDYVTYAEPIDDGYRYYYYEPGADEPYLVRDPYYSYGYRDGRIVTVYGRDGRFIEAIEAQRQAEAASRYYARARALRIAAREREQRGVAAAQWAERRAVLAAARADWSEARQRVPDWQAYRQRHAAEESQRLQPERIARAQAAERFAAWQREGQPGRPPHLYAPDTGRADRRDGARQIDQARQQEQHAVDLQRQAQRDMTQQHAAAEQQQQAQRTQANAQRDAARQRAAIDQQQALQERQAAVDQRGLRIRQQRDAQRQQVEQHRAVQQQQAQQQAIEQRGQLARQQREVQRQEAEQQRAVQQQQVRQRTSEQRGQQMQQQREAQRQQADQQRAAQQAQQRAAEQRGEQMRQQRDAQRQQAEQQRAQQMQQRQQAQQQAAQQRAAEQQQHAAQHQQPGPGRDRER